MEQTVAKQSKPLLMMKALLAAYLATGLMLLLLALLLYKMGLGENQVNLGILIIYIVSCFLGGFYLGKKSRKPEIPVGNGAGDWLCSASDRSHIFDGASDIR